MKCNGRSNKRLICISRRTCFVWEVCFPLPASANHQRAMSAFFQVLWHVTIPRTFWLNVALLRFLANHKQNPDIPGS